MYVIDNAVNTHTCITLNIIVDILPYSESRGLVFSSGWDSLSLAASSTSSSSSVISTKHR